MSSLMNYSMINIAQKIRIHRYRNLLQSTVSFSKKAKGNEFDIRYEKKTPIEHVLLRPGMYVGQTDWVKSFHWVFDPTAQRMIKKEVQYSPALLKIFDEILVNAADNVQRRTDLTEIKVEINSEEVLKDPTKQLKISIQNNGKSIPVAIHDREKIYIPELIFGHLLTGSNFDDTSHRLTGGSHGYGAKLTNIFSHKFQVEIYDAERHLSYHQVWEQNMSKCYPAIIESIPKKQQLEKGFIKISFEPDLQKFHYHPDKLTKEQQLQYFQDLLALLHRRTFDIAGCLHHIDVFYNQQRLPIDSFHDYVQQFSQKELPSLASLKEESEGGGGGGEETTNTQAAVVVEKDLEELSKEIPVLRVNDRLEFSLFPSTLSSAAAPWTTSSSTASLESLSFVNNVWTSRGGNHVTYLLNTIVDYLREYILKNHKAIVFPSSSSSSSSSASSATNMTAMINSLNNIIKNHLFLFVNCKIENPSFDGQTKDALLTKASLFQDSFELIHTNNPLNNLILKNFFQFHSNYYHTFLLQSILNEINYHERYKVFQSMNKTISSLANNKNKLFLHVPKLEDAHYAGSKKITESLKCTLLLTEGDSAKALAIAGLSSIGREYYGVMPLRGKVLNVRSVTSKRQILQNQELMNLCKAMNLNFDKKYISDEEFHELRYGSILLMCDQDYDGSHIKGLVINFIHYFWPALIHRKGFIQEFITPIVKVKPLKAINTNNTPDLAATVTGGEEGVPTKTNKKRTKKSSSSSSSSSLSNDPNAPNILSFYNLSEYEEWKLKHLSQPEQKKLYAIKYYKGLGTNTNEEGQEYFKNIFHHQKYFITDGLENNLIDLAFNKHRALDRKEWLLKNYSPNIFIDFGSMNSNHNNKNPPLPPPSPVSPENIDNMTNTITNANTNKEMIPYLSYSDFINKELIHFSFSDNVRSIPHVLDGLKPSQRKVLFGSFLKFPSHSSSDKEMKVMQLAGFIAEKTSYHHGEQSLHSTIVNMAQQFMGSNNIPYLKGIGQFGTRSKGGNDFASPRYIYTRLSPITRVLFPPEDDILLPAQEDDGIPIEPEYYLPILPAILLNGAKGIGTGWSTEIPSYNIVDIINYLEKKLTFEKLKQLQPGTKKLSPPLPPSPEYSPLIPYVHGFKGKIYPDEESMKNPSVVRKSYVSEGNLTVINRKTIEITELPVGRWTEDYKEFLIKLMEKGDIKSFQEHHSIHSVRFTITLPLKMIAKHVTDRSKKTTTTTTAAAKKKADEDEHEDTDDDDDDDDENEVDVKPKKKRQNKTPDPSLNGPKNIANWKSIFRLTSNIPLSNMFLFNEDNRIQQFNSPEDILEYFYPRRLKVYNYRKQLVLKDYYYDYYYAENQKNFLHVLLNGSSTKSTSSSNNTKGSAGKRSAASTFLEEFAQMSSAQELDTLMKSHSLLTEDEVSEKAIQRMKVTFKGHDIFPPLLQGKKKSSSSLSAATASTAVEDPEDGEDPVGATNTAKATAGKKGNVARQAGYDYLLRLPIQSMTKEKFQFYEKRLADLQENIDQLEQKDAYDLWLADLKKCREKYQQLVKEWKFD